MAITYEFHAIEISLSKKNLTTDNVAGLLVGGDELYRLVRYHLIHGVLDEKAKRRRLAALAYWTSARTMITQEPSAINFVQPNDLKDASDLKSNAENL